MANQNNRGDRRWLPEGTCLFFAGPSFQRAPLSNGFHAARHSDPVTFAWLIDHGLDVGLHYHPRGRHVVVAVRSLPFAIDTPRRRPSQ